MSDIILTIDGIDPIELYGENNSKFLLLKKAYPEVQITSRGNQIKIKGDKNQTMSVRTKVEAMVKLLKEKHELSTQTVADLLAAEQTPDNKISPHSPGGIIVYGKNGNPIKAKTKNQKALVDCCEQNDIVFAIGPAGTGKTYTAVALAVKALKAKLVKKIILTRPAVEAGESLGFLPGDMKEKVDPYLRPLYDALDDMIPADKLAFFIQNRVIEVAPLAFMRGRTLDHAFIILDEAQNCTSLQIKMFLTRLGPSAKAIVTGDLSQIDLPGHQKSGLRRALDILAHIPGIGQLFLTDEDVVRHRLVKEVIRSYAHAEEADEAERLRKKEIREKEREQKMENRESDNEYI
ncbi:MAG: PhoH family protein [Saprospiraceae bacterium]|nr:PhoH family protein [Saprospiraceae bacterium]MBK6564438.1 PhoH family protein [Saprospiraceae bacterium]MBK8371928.1 PhoH family protein [Saprospiraceae bacterium]MBK8818409.1 PhoH family protein [Saprospiraceae bacterium]MBK8853178.1 PhoH family protein [Saprospiraceae bacterium]